MEFWLEFHARLILVGLIDPFLAFIVGVGLALAKYFGLVMLQALVQSFFSDDFHQSLLYFHDPNLDV